MPVDFTEATFEAAIEHHLLSVAGYAKADPANFDRERALDPTVFIPFVKETQPETWKSLESLHGTDTESVVLDALCSDCRGDRRLPGHDDGEVENDPTGASTDAA